MAVSIDTRTALARIPMDGFASLQSLSLLLPLGTGEGFRGYGTSMPWDTVTRQSLIMWVKSNICQCDSLGLFANWAHPLTATVSGISDDSGNSSISPDPVNRNSSLNLYSSFHG